MPSAFDSYLMQRHFTISGGLLATLLCASISLAQSQGPMPILPSDLKWVSPPNLPGMQTAWVVGAERQSGPYVLRVKLAKGAMIPPHTHPDARTTTVLAGAVYVGFGAQFDPGKAVAVPTGGVYLVPADAAHYLVAKDGEVLYQENGVGPTGTAMLER
jgi:quercetin dioxygenase-like cupin family protein